MKSFFPFKKIFAINNAGKRSKVRNERDQNYFVKEIVTIFAKKVQEIEKALGALGDYVRLSKGPG